MKIIAAKKYKKKTINKMIFKVKPYKKTTGKRSFSLKLSQKSSTRKINNTLYRIIHLDCRPSQYLYDKTITNKINNNKLNLIKK